MIEEILSYVEPRNKGLFHVNRKMNAVLSNSEKLLNQFQINWGYYEQKDINVLMNSGRKYTSISIKTTHLFLTKNLDNVLRFYQIKHLKLEFSYFSAGEFYKILQLISHNLESIFIGGSNITNVKSLESKQLKFNKLTKLETLIDFTDHFLNAANLKELILWSGFRQTEEKNITQLLKFLVPLQNLEKLSISRGLKYLFSYKLSESNKKLLDQTNFKLKKLEVDSVRYREYQIFYPFLKKQKELTYLKLSYMEATIDVMKIIFNDLKMLRKIEFETFEFTGLGYDLWNLQINPSIEEITVRNVSSYWQLCESIPKVLKLNLLPNLKTFKFKSFSCSMIEILMALKQVQSLKTIQFEKCQEMPAIEIPQLNCVGILKSDEAKAANFLKANPQVHVHHL